MKSSVSYDWVPFYKELATKLLPYKNNRSELVEDVKKIFEIADVNMPTLEKDNQLVDIDPLTFFGLFNKTSMSDSKRAKILNAVAEVMSVSAPVPTSFDSIPVLNPINATYYHFADTRGKDDIDELWGLFESALDFAGNPTQENQDIVSKYFDLAINKKGNGNSKITMGLYWIAPDTFLNLDSRNEWYIYESGKIPEEVVRTLPSIKGKLTSKVYFEITGIMKNYLQSDVSKLKDFKELSFEAWRYSEEVNEKEKEKQKDTPVKTAGAAIADEDVRTVHYWLYSPGSNAEYWDDFYDAGIMAIGWGKLGDLRAYASKDEINQSLKDSYEADKSYRNSAYGLWQFANEMKTGDIVFVKKGRYQVIGRGVVQSDYEYDPDRDYYPNVRQVKWTNNGEWEHPGPAAMKTLTDITSYTDYVDKLNALFETDEEESDDENEVVYPPYEEEDFLSDVYMEKGDYETLVNLLKTKKNVILQGPPGVGKTYAAKRLAYSMMGVKDQNRVVMIQFHQSYSYEDFIMGYRPTETGFELRTGVFYNFCKKAEVDSDNDYFFIIDEINRGNLSKIFGELFMLIENDKRDTPMQLLYANEKFSVPGNVYIIGMMNTADRSLAMLDYALRRRFAFYEMKPGFDTDGFREYAAGLHNVKFNRLIECVKQLNEDITEDESLGEGFCIGHSYFCNLDPDTITDQTLSGIVEFELIPLLKEYWFDDPDNVRTWSDKLRSAIK